MGELSEPRLSFLITLRLFKAQLELPNIVPEKKITLVLLVLKQAITSSGLVTEISALTLSSLTASAQSVSTFRIYNNINNQNQNFLDLA